MYSPVEEIKSKLDIVDVLGEYIKLTAAGANLKANCPFHQEKTPSFMVSPERQIWHCFGCNKGGDIFGFVMEIDGVEFKEALKILAKKAGVQLTYENPELYSHKTRLLDILEQSAKYYHYLLLNSPKAEHVRRYLAERKINFESIEDFQLGYAPDFNDNLSLINFLKSKHFAENDIFLAGMVLQSQRTTGFYDRFRQRLMFPISDHNGQVVGFTGRQLPGFEDEKMGKYINTPQTLVYNKSGVLYGLNWAKNNIRKSNETTIVEGNMDLISLHQAGIKNVVASSGTALTNQQVRFLKRYSQNISICFDADEAGKNAALRGIEVALAEGMNVRIISIPSGKDPDDFVKSHCQENNESWQALVKQGKSVIDYYLDCILQQVDWRNNADLAIKKVTEYMLPKINILKNTAEQAYWLRKIAELLNIQEKSLWDDLNKLKKQKENVKNYENLEKKANVTINQEKNEPIKYSKDDLSLIQLIALVLKNLSNIGLILEQLNPEIIIKSSLFREELRDLYKELIIYYTYNDHREQLLIEPLIKELNYKNKNNLADLLNRFSLLIDKDFSGYDPAQIRKEIVLGVKIIKKKFITEELHKISQLIKEIETGLAPEIDKRQQLKDLSYKFSELTSELSKLGQ